MCMKFIGKIIHNNSDFVPPITDSMIRPAYYALLVKSSAIYMRTQSY